MLEHAEIIKSLYRKFLECKYAISTDSRNITPGSIFFALRGESFDGNKFAAGALGSGAAYAVVDDPAVVNGDNFVLVHDVLTTLQQLAAHHRYELAIPILAITGSNGKTTTKELIARVLGCKFEVSVTRGNLNNHIGVPLTILAMGINTEFGVVEMGASAPGEIAMLCRIAQPNFGLITNIGLAHLEKFKDLDGVKRGKGELFDYLHKSGGVAFYHLEDPLISDMISERKELQAVPYSETLGLIPNNLEGDYNRYNIAAAVAIGEYFKVPEDDIMRVIARYIPDNNRSQSMVTGRNNKLILDCYNANPSSMRAAINNFASSKSGENQQKIAILGDMLELGDWTAKEHEAILELALKSGFDQVLIVGNHFKDASQNTVIKTITPASFTNAEQLAIYLKENQQTGKNILIKGSRGIRLETLVELL